MRQDDSASGVGAVVAHVEQAAEHGVQPHHLEIRSANDTPADLARIAEANHGEAEGGKVANRAQRLDASPQVAVPAGMNTVVPGPAVSLRSRYRKVSSPSRTCHASSSE